MAAMNPLFAHFGLFAQRTRLDDLMENMSGGFRDHGPRINPQHFTYHALIAVAALAAVIVVLRLVSTARRRYRASPQWLFRRLCSAHHLTWRDARLLQNVARQQKVTDPSLMFIEPQRLDPANLPTRMLAWGARLTELRQRLFTAPATQAPALEEPRPVASDHPAVQPAGIPLFSALGESRPTMEVTDEV